MLLQDLWHTTLQVNKNNSNFDMEQKHFHSFHVDVHVNTISHAGINTDAESVNDLKQGTLCATDENVLLWLD